ncbi:MAG: 1-acyl-sn-glycerol-3-phosphate acyltransferase [Rhodoferax sp.]|nr:1-acyl-sn-glycerol-3-phosphate acyltransferase [Betaproteobacteria bacterium]NCN96900.1 1-acyl-sn-glycerol-3-phosphate acyltransferase [Rhodoferax sp.]NCP82587.1 1-acyl-sn-glycerol-3-phosphate acyltransferase [Rhodoferax sp.]NCS61575.1 1-acyl-sn-glycerol-3-phosphate acyltransferase [Rhodoferax sp.]PIZ21677.1 MAG: 1-acyl-sn-glycerol-3-phosphate acyltransferase [Comamonadaceae bacterium CG_4_10_14_0_8_um_filter_57_29]
MKSTGTAAPVDPTNLRSRLKAWASPVAAEVVSLFLLGLVRTLTGSQARWWGCPPKAEQRIYFANHQSHVDLVMIWAALPKELRHSTRAVAARDYWTKSPFKKWLTSAVFNVIYVSRTREADEDPLEPLIDALHAGDSLILFPEGTRGHADEPQPFKAGLYNLALKFPHIELIPAWIANVQRVMPKGEVVPVPVLCSVTFGAPMLLQDGEDIHVFLQRARSAVLALRDI